MLYKLHQCSLKEKFALLKVTKQDLFDPVCNCITITVHNRIPTLSQNNVGVFAKKKNLIRELFSTRTKTPRILDTVMDVLFLFY